MTEDPLLRAIQNAVDDATGGDRRTHAPSGLIAPRDGNAVPLPGYRIFVNDVEIKGPTAFKAGDNLRTERVK